MEHRRRTLALSLAGAASMAVISLYQLGLIRHLPEPPLPHLDADKVDASPEAYRILATPDALLGLMGYVVTAWLAGMGEPDRASSKPWLPLTLSAKVGVDAAVAGWLTVQQWRDHRAFCSWCLLASVMTAVTVPQVLPEARAALNTLRGR